MTEFPVDVLSPTYRRPTALAVTLTSLTVQSLPHFRAIVSDQTEDDDSTAGGEVQTVIRLLRARGRPVELLRHLPRRGLAEHRQFLLDRASAPYALFLDDDVLCEPELLARLLTAIEKSSAASPAHRWSDSATSTTYDRTSNTSSHGRGRSSRRRSDPTARDGSVTSCTARPMPGTSSSGWASATTTC